MTDFDDRFANRVREAFDAYEEPVDEAAWARTQAALSAGAASCAAASASGAAALAADRPPVARQRPLARQRWVAPLALALLLVASGIGVWALRDVPEFDEPAIASLPVTPEADTADMPLSAESPTPALTSGADLSGGAASGDSVLPSRATPEARRSPREAPRRALPPRERTTEPTSGAPVQTADASGGVEPPTPEPTVSGADTSEAPVVAEVPSVPRTPEAPSVVIRSERVPGIPVLPPEGPTTGRAREPGLSLVAASTSAFSDGEFASGFGASAGVVREFALARGLSISGGAMGAVNRFTLSPDGLTRESAFTIASDTGDRVDVPETRTLTTVALEVPVDVALHVASVPRGRLGVSVGLTSAVYLAQSFEDSGERYLATPRGDGAATDFSAQSYENRTTESPLSRFDLARQLNLGVRFTADDSPLAIEGYTRLPLGGLTSRDISLTTVGVRFRLSLR